MSSQIYELFGYLASDRNTEATRCRKKCKCPFMGRECDGGGNRYQSFLHLKRAKDRNLVDFFDGRTDDIPAGVCSLVTSNQVWIVCPRRLFTLDQDNEHTTHNDFCENLLRRYAPNARNQKAGVWSEVKIKYAEDADGEDNEKTFDYTFDYIICPTRPKPISEVAESFGVAEKKLETE